MRTVLFGLMLGLICLVASPANAQLVIFQGVADGNLTVVSLRRPVSALELKSPHGEFVAEKIRSGALRPPFDVARPDKVFKLERGGFRYVDFGNILPRWKVAFFTVAGAVLPRGSVNDEGIAVVVLPAAPVTTFRFGAGVYSAVQVVSLFR